MSVWQDQPLSAAFIKIFQAVGLFDHWLDVRFSLPSENQQLAPHAVQSIVWKEAGGFYDPQKGTSQLKVVTGCDKLSELEEEIVLAFMEPGTDNNTRMTIALNKAYKVDFIMSCLHRYDILTATIQESETRWIYRSPGHVNWPICLAWPHDSWLYSMGPPDMAYLGTSGDPSVRSASQKQMLH